MSDRPRVPPQPTQRGWTGPKTTTPWAIVATDGEEIHRFSITHDTAGLTRMDPQLLAAGV